MAVLVVGHGKGLYVDALPIAVRLGHVTAHEVFALEVAVAGGAAVALAADVTVEEVAAHLGPLRSQHPAANQAEESALRLSHLVTEQILQVVYTVQEI